MKVLAAIASPENHAVATSGENDMKLRTRLLIIEFRL